MIVFTDKGERVPKFRVLSGPLLHSPVQRTYRYGYPQGRHKWTVGFVAVRSGGSYKLWDVRYIQAFVNGSEGERTLATWLRVVGETQLMSRRFPTVASIEVYLRMVYGGC